MKCTMHKIPPLCWFGAFFGCKKLLKSDFVKYRANLLCYQRFKSLQPAKIFDQIQRVI